jgi:hypothetical protein
MTDRRDMQPRRRKRAMFQIIGGKNAAIRSAGRGRDHDRRLLVNSRLNSIAVAFGCPGIGGLCLWVGPLAGRAAVEE